MKLALFFALAIASANAFADIALPPAEPPGQSVGTSPYRLPPMPVPVIPPPAVYPDNDELMNLIRAQTDAIKSLSIKINALEVRVGKIERGRH